MSSIAYVTDEKMLDYHRLCRSRSILFWRLTTKNKFTDFHHGDLLFFFAHGALNKRKKGFVGYGHYEATRRLSLSQMWKQYGTMTGYDTREQLAEAIGKAARGPIPKTMQCLLLKDVVFFVSPVYPKDVGIHIPSRLESYCYIDKDDPRVTARILHEASRLGIDLWTSDNYNKPADVFRRDEVRHFLAETCSDMGELSMPRRQKADCHRLAKAKAEEDGWEFVRMSKTDCFRYEDGRIRLALPFSSGVQNRSQQIEQLLGRMTWYRMRLLQEGIDDPMEFTVLSDQEDTELEALVKELNERL